MQRHQLLRPSDHLPSVMLYILRADCAVIAESCCVVIIIDVESLRG